MKIVDFAVIALAIAGLSGVAYAGEEAAGTTAGNFLSVGSGPAVFGRGTATLALSGDVGTSAWNPGALGFLRETQISLSHATLIDEHVQEYLTIGGRMRRTDLRWSAFGLYESEGSFEGRDANNNSTGSFDVSSFAAGGHLAYPIAGFAAIGFGGKWVNENLGVSRGSGVAWDAGIQVHSGMLGFGVAAQNAFGKMRFGNQSFNFPTNYGAGIALNHAESGLSFAVDANFPTSYYKDVRSGVEWRWRDVIAVRGGYRATLGAPENESLKGPTFGFGAGVYGMWMDYGYVIPGTGEAQHRFGLSLRPSRMNTGGGAIGESALPLETPVRTVKPVAPAPVAPSKSAPKSEAPANPAKHAPISVVPEPTPASAPAPAATSVPVQTPPAVVLPAVTPPQSMPVTPPATSAQPARIQTAPASAAQTVADSKPSKKMKKQKAKKNKRAKDAKAKDAKAQDATAKSQDPFDAVIDRAKNLNAGDTDNLKK